MLRTSRTASLTRRILSLAMATVSRDLLIRDSIRLYPNRDNLLALAKLRLERALSREVGERNEPPLDPDAVGKAASR